MTDINNTAWRRWCRRVLPGAGIWAVAVAVTAATLLLATVTTATVVAVHRHQHSRSAAAGPTKHHPGLVAAPSSPGGQLPAAQPSARRPAAGHAGTRTGHAGTGYQPPAASFHSDPGTDHPGTHDDSQPDHPRRDTHTVTEHRGLAGAQTPGPEITGQAVRAALAAERFPRVRPRTESSGREAR